MDFGGFVVVLLKELVEWLGSGVVDVPAVTWQISGTKPIKSEKNPVDICL